MKPVMFLISVVVLVFAASFVFGAGGGGNPNPPPPSPEGSSSSPSGSAPRDEFSNVQCTDAGSISFTIKADSPIVITRDDTGESINYSGAWEGDSFVSDEGILTAATTYKLKNAKNTASVRCPGLVFSCSLVAFKEASCSSNRSVFTARVRVVNDNATENLKFNFLSDNRILSYAATSHNAELERLGITRKGDTVELSLYDGPLIDVFEIVHQKCIGKRYLYTRVNCPQSLNQRQNNLGQQGSAQARTNPETLKCGGLLDITDRVRCRINLEAEHDEYQNFYPEECKTHTDSERCLATYRAVSACWDLPLYKNRAACLKKQITYNGAASCVASDDACKKAENEKLLTLIKLRFYNLEEQAEMLEEQGLLDKESLIAFVVKIENKKKEFNQAKTKQEMQQIILDVRALWRGLMKEVKSR